jgi:REP element-mobilizing transposase RayT
MKLLKSICLGISKRYEISFLEIGSDKNRVHFLIQSSPKYSVTEIVRIIKSITAKKIFEKHPEVKKTSMG